MNYMLFSSEPESKAEMKEQMIKIREDMLMACEAGKEVEKNIPALERKGWCQIQWDGPGLEVFFI